nr:hypothetical protein [Tanacetum cinerariifolium]
ILKRRREDDDQEGPSAGPNQGSKRQKEKTTCQREETLHPVFETGVDDQPIVQTSQHPEWFSQPRRPPSPNRAWNTALPAAQGDAQSWISDLARQTNARSSFNELLDTPIDYSNFIMHRLNILIEKMEGNKSIQRSDEQRNLYKALVEAYDADKAILDTYGESTILKQKREDDDQEGPSAGSDRGSTIGSQSRQLSSSESAFAEEPVQTTCQMEEPPHLVFETGANDQPIVQTSEHPEWFSQPRKPPSPDRDWNKTLSVAQGDAQSWISDLARQTDARLSFNELLDNPIDFSNFIMNRVGVATLTPELLAGPTYELMRGSYNSLTELEYNLEEVYKATTDQLDWVNLEGQQYPHNLLQPIPLIPDNRGRRSLSHDRFNNDVSFEEELVYQRLRKTLTHVLELSSCIYLDDRAR